MTAKEYLRQLIDMNSEIESIYDQIAWLRAQATKVTTTYSDMPPGGESKDISDIMNDIFDLEGSYVFALGELTKLKREASAVIEKITDNRHRTVLRKRYLNSENWETIADETGYSLRQVYRLHGEALCAYEKKMSLNVTR